MPTSRPLFLILSSVGTSLALALTAACGSVPKAAPEPTTPTPMTSVLESPTLTASPTPSPTSSPSPSPTSSPTPPEEPSAKPSEKRSAKPAEKPARKPEQPRTPTGSRTIYLTFDDGPGTFTAQVLDLLARYDAKATFFVLGQNVGNGSLVRRAARAGHSIQNHSWNHPDLRTLSAAQLRSQIRRTDAAIRNAGGGRSSCVRPPYGATNAAVRGVLRDLGKKQSLWDIATEDWRRPGANVIYRRVIQGARSGAVVLAHDGGGNRTQTVAALSRILSTLKQRGYRFGTLCR